MNHTPKTAFCVGFCLGLMALAVLGAVSVQPGGGGTGGSATNVVWGAINGTLASQTDLAGALASKAETNATLSSLSTNTITGTGRIVLESAVTSGGSTNLTDSGTNVLAKGGILANYGAFTNSLTLNGNPVLTNYTDTTANWTASGSTNSSLAGNSYQNALTATNGVTVGPGSAASPSLNFGTSGNGIYAPSANYIGFSLSSALRCGLDASGKWTLYNGNGLAFDGGVSQGDLFLLRDAANTLALRNGTAAQSARIYTTWTDASNYERLGINTAAGSITLAAESAGPGSANMDIVLTPKGSGALKFGADGTYNIGGTATGRPAIIYAQNKVISAGDVTAGRYLITTSGLYTPQSGGQASFLYGGADGIALLGNTGDNGFTGLRLGQNVASPSSVYIRPGDGSGTDKIGGNLTIQGGISTGTGRGGALIHQTSLSSTTSSTANTLSTRRYESAKFVDLTALDHLWHEQLRRRDVHSDGVRHGRN